MTLERAAPNDFTIDVYHPDIEDLDPELPKDTEVLRTLVRENRLVVLGGRYPCAGVYAIVASARTIRAGDAVSLT